MTNTTTKYRIHVKGQIHGLVADTYLHTYEVDRKPESREEIFKIAGDFQSITDAKVEEVVVTVRKNLIHVR